MPRWRKIAWGAHCRAAPPARQTYRRRETPRPRGAPARAGWRMTTFLEPRPGFEWSAVNWGGPDEPRTEWAEGRKP